MVLPHRPTATSSSSSLASPFSYESTRQHSTDPLYEASSRQFSADPEAPSAPRASHTLLEEDVVVRTSKWSLAGLLCLPTDVRHKDHQDRRKVHEMASVPNHPDFRRLKLALITIGVASVLMANVTYVGFITPPQPPEVLVQQVDSGLLTNIQAHAAKDPAYNQRVRDTANSPHPVSVDYDNYDYAANITPDEYLSFYATVAPQTFCSSSLKTAFAVTNGISLATLFLVAVLPVYAKFSMWDLQLAHIGTAFLIISMVTMVVAFILAGLITVGVSSTSSCFVSEGKEGSFFNTGGIARDKHNFETSVFVIIAVVAALSAALVFASVRQRVRGCFRGSMV